MISGSSSVSVRVVVSNRSDIERRVARAAEAALSGSRPPQGLSPTGAIGRPPLG